MNGQLLEFVKAVKVSNGASAGTTAVNGTAVDMSQDGGYDGIAFLVDLGTVVDGSVLTLTPQQGEASDGSDAVAISGAATAAVTASTSSNKLLQTDTIRPTGTYVRPQLTRTTQNATINTIIALLYRSRKAPVAVDATVLASKIAQA